MKKDVFGFSHDVTLLINTVSIEMIFRWSGSGHIDSNCNNESCNGIW